jgi:Ca2+-binding RTX toxin-like protein
MFPDTVEIFGAFDTRSFFAPASTAIATISGDATVARVTLQTGKVLVYTGTDLTFSNGVPTGGTVTAVSVLTAGDVPLATLTLTQNPWNFADIITDIPYQTYLATPQQVVDTLDPTQATSASTIFGGNQDDFIASTGGADTIRGLGGDDTIGFAGAFFRAGGGRLTGDEGDDLYIIRDALVLLLDAAGGGNDTIRTSVSLDLSGGENPENDAGEFETIRVIGQAGLSITGTATDNRITGNIGADTLSGGDGADRIEGWRGADVLTGGTGTDTLIGGGDADRFVFATGFGADRVADFNANIDVIDLTGLDGVTSFQDLAANFMRQDGRNVVIDMGAGDVLTLSNVRLATLDAADFLI